MHTEPLLQRVLHLWDTIWADPEGRFGGHRCGLRSNWYLWAHWKGILPVNYYCSLQLSAHWTISFCFLGRTWLQCFRNWTSPLDGHACIAAKTHCSMALTEGPWGWRWKGQLKWQNTVKPLTNLHIQLTCHRNPFAVPFPFQLFFLLSSSI